jgi:hypothetical protein
MKDADEWATASDWRDTAGTTDSYSRVSEYQDQLKEGLTRTDESEDTFEVFFSMTLAIGQFGQPRYKIGPE